MPRIALNTSELEDTVSALDSVILDWGDRDSGDHDIDSIDRAWVERLRAIRAKLVAAGQ